MQPPLIVTLGQLALGNPRHSQNQATVHLDSGIQDPAQPARMQRNSFSENCRTNIYLSQNHVR